jgi:hypothetical protein
VPELSSPHISLDAIRQRVEAAEQDGWYGYDEEARADVRWLLEQLETAERERDSLAARLRAQGYNVYEILAFDAASDPTKQPYVYSGDVNDPGPNPARNTDD